MKHTHPLTASQKFSAKEKRMLHAFNDDGADTAQSDNTEVELAETAAREQYSEAQLAKLGDAVDKPENATRVKFLKELDPLDDGRIQLENAIGLKFGKNEEGKIILTGTPNKAALENLLKYSTKNQNTTYTLKTMVGKKMKEVVVDEVTFDVLNTYASLNIDDVAEIATNRVPTDPRQKNAFISRYKKAALADPKLLALADPEDLPLFGKQYEQMVRQVVAKDSSAVQYIMMEWASEEKNNNAYTSLWTKAVSDNPMLLEHLTAGEIPNITDYPTLCRTALRKDPKAVQFVQLGEISDVKDQESIIALALSAGPEIQKLLPKEARAIAAKFRLGNLAREMSTKEPTAEEVEQLANLLNDEFEGDLVPVQNLIEMRPLLIHVIPAEWARSHVADYKTLWIKAVTSNPDVIARPGTLSTMRQYIMNEAEQFYSNLAKEAMQKTVRGQRRDDGSKLVNAVDAEWRKQRPDDFRHLFIKEDGTPTGDDSLRMLLTIEGTKEAFNNEKPTKADPEGYPKALSAALTEASLLKVLKMDVEAKKSSMQIKLETELRTVPELYEQYAQTLQKTFTQYPDLEVTNLSTMDHQTLVKLLQDAKQIPMILRNRSAILREIPIDTLNPAKKSILAFIRSGVGGYDSTARTLNQLPPVWKKNKEDMRTLVRDNASVYRYLDEDLRNDLGVLKLALVAEEHRHGSLNWEQDVPSDLRLKIGTSKLTSDDIDKVVVPVAQKDWKISPTPVDDLDPDAIQRMTMDQAKNMMRGAPSPTSILHSLIQKESPLVKNSAFLTQVFETYPQIFGYLMDDAADARTQAVRGDFELRRGVEELLKNNGVVFFNALSDTQKCEYDRYLRPMLETKGVNVFVATMFPKPDVLVNAVGVALVNTTDTELRRSIAEYAVNNKETILNNLTPDQKKICTESLLEIKNDVTLLQKATYVQKEFTMYSDDAERDVAPANKANFVAWKEAMRLTNPKGIQSIMTDDPADKANLRTLLDNSKKIVNPSALIAKEKVNWTKDSLEQKLQGATPDMKVRLLAAEMTIRLRNTASESDASPAAMQTRAHHEKNLAVLYAALTAEELRPLLSKAPDPKTLESLKQLSVAIDTNDIKLITNPALRRQFNGLKTILDTL